MGKPSGTDLRENSGFDTARSMEEQTSRSFTSGNVMPSTRHSNLLPCFFRQQVDNRD
jgi:hypothetical protein